MAWHVTISPAWFDPSTAPPQITPFGMLYAIHDALVRPYPGQKMGPSLAESWTGERGRPDLRVQAAPGPEVPQRRPADDRGRQVQLRALQGRGGQDPAGARRAGRDRRSAGRALSSQGAVARLHDVLRHDGQRRRHRRAEEVPDAGRRRRLQEASDRRRPLQVRQPQAGHRGRCSRPITGYWRRVPNVKTLVMRSVPEATTRAVMLKTGEADIAYALDGPDAEAIKNDPRMQLVASKHASIFWIEFTEQWDPKSPWHDKRLRQAVNLRARPQAHQRGGLPRLLPAGRRDRAARDGLRAAGRAAALRPAEGQAAARRSRLSERARRRRVRGDPGLPDRGRGGGERPQRRRHPRHGCGRWSARPSTPPGRRRSCAGCS